MNGQTTRRVAIVGGVRTPFCRSNTSYQDVTNLDMLTACLQGLVNRYQLDGKRIDEVFGGAVTTHSKDWNMAREAVLNTTLSPYTNGVTMQQACGTSLQAALIGGAKIACGEIDSFIACGSDTTSDAPLVLQRKLAQRLIKLPRAKSVGQKLKLFKGFSPAELAPQPPQNAEPKTGLSMGQHCERMAREWGISRQAQDELAVASHQNAASAWDEGFFDDLVTDFAGVRRDNNVRADSSLEGVAKLKPAFDRKSGKGTLTAANSTPLTDGASAVLLCSEEWAEQHKLPVSAYLTHGRSASVDFVEQDEGLLMSPTVAMAEMLQRAGLSLQDFDLYEIHEAFAAQVLCTVKAWESEDYCRERLGLNEAMGSIDTSSMNIKGSSIAIGHPFAATGARITATLAEMLANSTQLKTGAKGVISICAAGGMGVTAILEKA